MMNFNIFNIIMLLGGLQGLIFVLIIFFSKKFKSTPNYILAALILNFALNNIQYFLKDTGIVGADNFFKYIYFPFTNLGMVLYYLYIRQYLRPNAKLYKKLWWLFVPFFISLIIVIGYKVQSFARTLTPAAEKFYISALFINEIFGALYSTILLILAIRMILKYRKNPDHQKSFTTWLVWISYIAFAMCAVWVFCAFGEFFFKRDFDLYYFLWIGESLDIYILGHIGLYKYGIIQEQKKLKKFSASMKNMTPVSTKNEHISGFENYIVKEKKYLDSNLTLESVADQLKLSKSYLSRMINSELKMSFSDYINSLRVEEAKQYMNHPEFYNYTLVAIGLEAGFNSKSTFINAFKKHTGFTPSEFKKQHS